MQRHIITHPFTNSWTPTHYIHESLSGDLNDNLIEVKDDLVLDVLDIMSQSYVDTFEEETEEDTILDVVDIISQTYWENHSEWEIQLYIGVYYYYIWLYIRYIYIYICV